MKWRVGAKNGAGEALWKSTKQAKSEFTQALALYPKVIAEMIKTNTTKKPKNTAAMYLWGTKFTCMKKLRANDAWFGTEFGSSMKVNGEASKEDLKRMLQWKWARGKYRPGTTKFTDNNRDEDVRAIVKSTLQILAPLDSLLASTQSSSSSTTTTLTEIDINAIITEAIQQATTMPQIGPASATALLAARYPEFCPMYADEAFESIGMYREPYTLERYCTFAEKLRKKASQLGECWTANKVCDALFAASKAEQLGLGRGSARASTTAIEERPKKKTKK